MTRLLDLIAEDRFGVARDAIVAGLAAEFTDVKIRSHPGKLDIYDVVKMAALPSPCVLVGWTRMRSSRVTDGSYTLPVDWAAYIVAEDYADTATRTRIDRDVVANAIGSRILAILNDPDLSGWGLQNISLPDPHPGPELRPMFTAKESEKGTAYYAVTWSQSLADLGPNFMGGATPAFVEPGADPEDPRPGLKFESDDLIPPEIKALMESDAEGGE